MATFYACFCTISIGIAFVAGDTQWKSECIPTITDEQAYYSVRAFKEGINSYWIDLKDDSKQHVLAQSPISIHRVNLTFGFQFFGQTMDHVYLMNQGGVSMHPDDNGIKGAHFIGPLWDHLNLTSSNDSAIYFEDFGERFVVEWRNVYSFTVDPTPQGPFHFEIIVHRNGTILFLYKEMPHDIALKSSFIGIRSGIDIRKEGIRASVAYRGIHDIAQNISSGTVIIFTPFSICDLAKNSLTCTSEGVVFYCKGCKITQHCPDDVETLQQWLRDNCRNETPASCTSESRGSGGGTTRRPACTPKITDEQAYYSVTTVKGEVKQYWKGLKDDSKQHVLAQSQFPFHRVNLTFGFQFFGQIMDHVYLTSAGGMAMHPNENGIIGAHFIGPFWDHFNLSFSEDSAIYFEIIEDSFVVEWRNVYCYNIAPTVQGPLHFETIVRRDGTIIFLYKKMPHAIAMKSSFIGIRSGIDIRKSDIRASVAYRSIHDLAKHIDSDTVIIFTPLSICELAKNALTCSSEGAVFYCKGCKVTQHCPDDVSNVLQWLRNSCKYETPPSCISESQGPSASTIVVIVVVVVVLVLLSILGGWFLFAYRNPTSPSGRWLIEHRPSQWLGLILRQKGSTKEDQESTSTAHEDDDPGY